MAITPQGPTVPEPGSYDEPNGEGERRRLAEESLRRDRIAATQGAVLATQGGREWLWALLTSYHTFELQVAMSGSDFENGFWLGQREAGLRLFRALAQVSPSNFALMLKEHDGR